MVKQGPWKYWALAPDTEVLFNLDMDPHEEGNLAERPEFNDRLRDLRAQARERRSTPGSGGQRRRPHLDRILRLKKGFR